MANGYPPMNQQSGPVAGYAHLDAVHADTEHVSRVVLGGLEQLAEKLGRTLTIFSGYRSPSYSEAVGGYSADPHTRGVAADVNVGGLAIGTYLRGVGLDPVQTIGAVGLESGDQPGFYHGGTDPAHVQIPGSGVDKTIVDYGTGPAAAPPPETGPAPITRPGGEPQTVGVFSGIGDVFHGVFGKLWGIAKDPFEAVWSIAKSIAFLIHFVTSPDNWLRLIEFLIGAGLIVYALAMFVKVLGGADATPHPIQAAEKVAALGALK